VVQNELDVRFACQHLHFFAGSRRQEPLLFGTWLGAWRFSGDATKGLPMMTALLRESSEKHRLLPLPCWRSGKDGSELWEGGVAAATALNG
jgi:hypothetical protein